jgi:hypothetical protein
MRRERRAPASFPLSQVDLEAGLSDEQHQHDQPNRVRSPFAQPEPGGDAFTCRARAPAEW